MLRCGGCGRRDLCAFDFYRSRLAKSGRSSQCRSCMKAYTKAWRKRNPKKHVAQSVRQKRRSNLKKYGLSKEADACEICGRKTARRLSLDHDHATGEFRGFLCARCNLGLGQFDDSIDLLQRAISYLKEKNAARAA